MTTSAADLHTLTGAYACDALAPDERTAFRRHLDACPDCRQEVAELRATTAVLGLAAAEAPPARLRAAVLAQVAGTRQVPPTPAGHRKAGRRWVNRLIWGLAATLIPAGVVLGVALTQNEPSRSGIPAAVQEWNADDLKMAKASADGMGVTVFASHSRDRAMVMLDGPAPPAGSVYQFWLLDASGAARPSGMTPADGRMVPVSGLGDARNIAITLEPMGGSAVPSGKPLMALPLPA
jgi:anti-sigma-K factor RskA